jgi:ABC-type lipoprotein release transport system permease subunit
LPGLSGEHHDVNMGASSPGALWSRSDLRARAKSLVVLGVLVGLTIGLAAAAYDGARRTDSALTRLQSRDNASDAVVFATQAALVKADFSKLAARPEVKQLSRWGLAFGNLDGDPEGTLFVPMDGTWLNTVDRPIVVAGRMFDPQAADEIVVSDDARNADGSRIKVGATYSFTAMTPEGDFSKPASGQHLDVRVVGIIHTSLSYTFTGGAFLSPGFVTRYGESSYVAENAVIQLRNPKTDIGALRRDASADVAEGVPVLDLHVTARRVTATTDVEGAMLRLLAAIVALAGVAFVGQALARSAATVGADAQPLRAMGMTRRELVVAALRPHVVTAAIAVVMCTLTAAIASRWFPVGLGGGVDPDRGIQVNVALVALAAVVTALLTVGVALLGSWSATRRSGVHALRRGAWLAHLPLARPIAARVGARMAFEGTGVERKGGAWPALIGAAAAVTGVVAIVTVNHGLVEAVAHPEVAGVAWDASITPAQDDVSLSTNIKQSLVDAVAKQPGVAAVGTVARVVSQIGELGVPVFTVIDQAAGPPVNLVSLSGRAPQSDDEIVLGPSTARDLGVKAGDTVTLADGRPAAVVGLGLFPSDVHAQFDEGALVSSKRWKQLATLIDNPDDNLTVAMLIAVRFSDRANLDTQIDALATTFGSTVEFVAPVEEPLELTNLHNVRRLPTVLAIFLAVLGAVAVGHALFSSVYRRRRDFAVLQSLGVTRGGVRGMITAQATVVGLAGLLIGVPVGLVAGREGWRAITDRVPLTFRSPLTVLAVIVVVPVALIAANLLAVIPARRASKAKPALVLRSE